MYRPLPDGLTIKSSPIEGLGLFATNEIKANTLIEKYNYKEGKELGNKLSEIEEFWIENSFKISDKDLDKIVKN